MIPVSATECTCNQCGAELYIGRTNPKRPDDYLMPDYCPMCGLTKSLTGVTITAMIQGADPSRAVDFDGECAICGRTLKEHSLEGITACAQTERHKAKRGSLSDLQ
jgi:hypothetical protein